MYLLIFILYRTSLVWCVWKFISLEYHSPFIRAKKHDNPHIRLIHLLVKSCNVYWNIFYRYLFLLRFFNQLNFSWTIIVYGPFYCKNLAFSPKLVTRSLNKNKWPRSPKNFHMRWLIWCGPAPWNFFGDLGLLLSSQSGKNQKVIFSQWPSEPNPESSSLDANLIEPHISQVIANGSS